MTDVATVARGLSEAQRKAFADFDADWRAGPSLSGAAIKHLPELRDADLVDRRFGDDGPPCTSAVPGGLSVKLSACWHFRLTDLGLAVRAHLLSGEAS